MFLKINNRLQNNVTFLFCHFASVIAITVSTWATRTTEAIFCSLHPEAWLCERLSLQLLIGGKRRGKRRRKERKDGRPDRRGCSEHRGNQFRAEQYRKEKSYA